MLHLQSLSSFLFLTVIIFSNCEDLVEVELPQGRLIGTINETYFTRTFFHSFRGVPYAEPPVGNLRFQPPQPHSGWGSIYKAHENKPLCLQFNTRFRANEEPGVFGSEDCLYLNIYTPATEGLYPVVVFDYNDNFRSGFNESTYSPDLFIEKDIIVVTINYRLGVLGYLTTDDGVIPANNGIKDFIMALQWIQENIKYFSGDHNNVTLMGSRGGAVLIEILLYSEKAKGLFQKVMIQGGTAMEPIFFSNMPSIEAFQLGEKLNIKADNSETLLEKLLEVQAEELVRNEIAIANDEFLDTHQLTVMPFVPVLDTESTDPVIKSLPEKSKIVNDVPVLIGFNSRNGLDLIAPVIIEPRLLQNITYENFYLHSPIRTNFRFDRNASGFYRVIEEIWDFYFQAHPSPKQLYKYAIYIGDVLQNYAINYAAKKIAKEVKSPVYYYLFDYRGILNENSQFLSSKSRISIEHWGATIGDELCYLHFCSRMRKTYDEVTKLVSEQPEIKTLKKMIALWTNFIKTGNPTPSDDDEILKNIKWTPMNEETNYLHIARKLSMKDKPLGEREEFWDTYLDKYSKLADDGVVKIIIKDEL